MGMQIGKPIWQEDDSGCYDREQLESAWKRLFGESLDVKKNLEVRDDGDATFYRMPNGYIACHSYDGGAIYQAAGYYTDCLGEANELQRA